MFILDVDDAGSVGNNEVKYFVPGGIALFERDIQHLEHALAASAAGAGLQLPTAREFHGNRMRPGTKRWCALRDSAQRRRLIIEASEATAVMQGHWALFGAVVHKAAVSPRGPAEYAFEQICGRFGRFLARTKRDGQSQRGLIALDRSTKETRLHELATTFRRTGHSCGRLRKIVDVPFFVDLAASRAIRYADLVTHALWRRFKKGGRVFLDTIKQKFDNLGGVVHGLIHERCSESGCDCPYGASRRRLGVAT